MLGEPKVRLASKEKEINIHTETKESHMMNPNNTSKTNTKKRQKNVDPGVLSAPLLKVVNFSGLPKGSWGFQ